MFHVIDPETGHHIFTFEDPRKDGFEGAVQENVSLVPPQESWHEWPDGERRPELCLGASSEGEGRYQVFRTTEDCRRAGFLPLGPNYGVFETWAKLKKPGGTV